MSHDCDHFQCVGKLHRAVAAAFRSETENTAGSVRHVFFCQCMVFVVFQSCIFHPGYFRMVRQELRNLLCVLAVALHAQMQSFQTDVGQERILRRLAGAHVAHQLCGRFCDVGFLSEFLGIDNAVIRLVRSGESREFVGVRIPVKVSGVYDRSAYCHRVSVHIFGRGVCDDVHTILEGLAIDRSGKGVVADHRYPVVMCQFYEFFNVEDNTRRIGDRLGKNGSRVGFKIFLQFFRRQILVYQRRLDPETFQRNAQQVGGSAVNLRRADHVGTGFTDICHRQQCRGLSGRCQHRCRSAFQITDLLCNHVAGRVLKSGIKISFFFQIEQFSHLFAGLIFECRALINRKHSRFPVLWLPSALDAD